MSKKTLSSHTSLIYTSATHTDSSRLLYNYSTTTNIIHIILTNMSKNIRQVTTPPLHTTSRHSLFLSFFLNRKSLMPFKLLFEPPHHHHLPSNLHSNQVCLTFHHISSSLCLSPISRNINLLFCH